MGAGSDSKFYEWSLSARLSALGCAETSTLYRAIILNAPGRPLFDASSLQRRVPTVYEIRNVMIFIAGEEIVAVIFLSNKVHYTSVRSILFSLK